MEDTAHARPATRDVSSTDRKKLAPMDSSASARPYTYADFLKNKKGLGRRQEV
jgi:hypothetical protein